VVQVVPPALTAEQARQAEAEKAQADADAQLLHLYSSLEDVDRAKARKLAELDALIGVAQGNLRGFGVQQRNLQSQAADLERAGRPVPQSLIDQLDDLRDQQQGLNLQIERYRELRRQVEADFARDRARVALLLK
jgi:DNA repair exonuclease SbcCD ATPase subunit